MDASSAGKNVFISHSRGLVRGFKAIFKRTQRTKSTSWPSISHTLSLACFKSLRCDRSSIDGECIPQGAHARHGGSKRMNPQFCPLRAHRRRKPTPSSLPQPCDPEQVYFSSTSLGFLTGASLLSWPGEDQMDIRRAPTQAWPTAASATRSRSGCHGRECYLLSARCVPGTVSCRNLRASY